MSYGKRITLSYDRGLKEENSCIHNTWVAEQLSLCKLKFKRLQMKNLTDGHTDVQRNERGKRAVIGMQHASKIAKSS